MGGKDGREGRANEKVCSAFCDFVFLKSRQGREREVAWGRTGKISPSRRKPGRGKKKEEIDTQEATGQKKVPKTEKGLTKRERIFYYLIITSFELSVFEGFGQSQN